MFLLDVLHIILNIKQYTHAGYPESKPTTIFADYVITFLYTLLLIINFKLIVYFSRKKTVLNKKNNEFDILSVSFNSIN